MHLFNKPINKLELADIQTLIDNEIPESRTLDYKRDLYGSNDDGKREFLCDVSAFANTLGGHLIIGVHEEERIPKLITPVDITDVDIQQQRFENLLRTATDPPIRGVEFQPINAGDGKYVLVINIPRSISRPHTVSHGKHWRFYGRNSVGKYPYEVDDVRRAILQSETLAVKIRNFRNDRLAHISIGDTPVPLQRGAKIVLHVIPVSAFELGQRHDLFRLSNTDLWPICARGCNHRINVDGVVTYLGESDVEPCFSYTQAFYSGIIEAVDCQLLRVHNNKRGIPSKIYESGIIGALRKYLATLATLGVESPLWICLSLLNVKGYFMEGPDLWLDDAHPIDRAELILPEIPIEDTSVPAGHILKPAFDSIWNACGYDRSRNYDEDGN